MKMKEWFSSPDRWCKRNSAIDRHREDTACNVSNLTNIHAMCLLGAVHVCYPDFDKQKEIMEKIRIEIERPGIVSWNDGTTFEVVKALVEKLDI